MQGVDRASGEGLVRLEKPAQRRYIAVSAIVQNCQQTGKPFHDLAVFVEEFLGNPENPVALDCDDLAIAEQLVHLRDRQPDALRYIGQLEQGYRRIQDIITIRNRAHHGSLSGRLVARHVGGTFRRQRWLRWTRRMRPQIITAPQIFTTEVKG